MTLITHNGMIHQRNPDYERAKILLADCVTALRDLHVGYPEKELHIPPVELIARARFFFESIGELDNDTRNAWEVS